MIDDRIFLFHLGGDYMIPVRPNEVSICPTGTDFTLQWHVEIKFSPGKAG